MHSSDPHKKPQQAYGLKNSSYEPKKKIKDVESDNGTIWTLCPYCYYLYEYDGVYEDCCLRCQNCRRPFHCMAVAPPAEEMMVEGKEQYYCGIGCFPLNYNLGSFLGDKKGENLSGDSFLNEKKVVNEELKTNSENVVVISDDSDDDYGSGERGEDKKGENHDVGMGGEIEKDEGENMKVRVDETGPVVQGSERPEVKNDRMKMKKKVKSAARNTKKVMGRGKKYVKAVYTNSESEEDAVESQQENGSRNGTGERSCEDDLVFFSGRG